MSKSLGNSPDPLDLIRDYGADGVRTGMLFSSPAGNDLLFNVKLCEQGRNFSNKIWNALRLVKGWSTTNDQKVIRESDEVAIDWMEARINQVLLEIDDHFGKFRISDALLSVYKLIWDDFCSWFLEAIKPDLEQPIALITRNKVIDIFEKLMKIAHPFMPFITEEVYQQLRERDNSDSIVITAWPKPEPVDHEIIAKVQRVFEVVANVRNIRQQKQISPRERLRLFVRTENFESYYPASKMIWRLANISDLDFVTGKIENAMSFHIGSDEWFIPITQEIDHDTEIDIVQKEIDYLKGFLVSVLKKLDNEKFVNNAPAHVLDVERKKRHDAEKRIVALEEKLASLLSMK
jgi:valyl-tRNA synthetase